MAAFMANDPLVKQRVYGLALGYEDLNDHEKLRRDPLLALLSGKSEPTQESLAGKSTLNRLELTLPQADAAQQRYKKILFDPESADRLLVDLFVEAHASPPAEIILDLDATDDTLPGKQEGRFFHGYYGHYCYLPLYIFAGDYLLWLVSARRTRMAALVRSRSRAPGQTTPFPLACGQDHPAGGFGVLPRRVDELV
jgi:Transposase DDE domain group 1